LDGKVSPKPTSEWDDKQNKEKDKKKIHGYNVKAMNVFLCV